MPNARKYQCRALDDQVEMLMHGCEFGDPQLEASMRERLRGRLAVAADERRPLRVYTGYDPTAPDLHLGHAITLRAMRRFQRLGHHVIVVVGTRRRWLATPATGRRDVRATRPPTLPRQREATPRGPSRSSIVRERR
ncbi:MAG: hypothetical protein ACM3ML_03500 [Micromonosporaceae bacterium]